MKTNVQFSLSGLLIFILIIFASIFLSNCKGHVEVFGIIDSVENCSPPYVVYFYPDAEHRTRKLEYTWDFGDGTTSHDKEPVHNYNEHGIYQVTLSIKQNKSFDSKTITLYLTEDSTAVYSDWDYASRADSLWVPAYVEFQNYSLHSTSFLWEFGDGGTSPDKNPFYVYETQGTYTTVLNAICNEDTSKFARVMVIKPPPTDILVDEVAIWMPDDLYLGTDVWVEVYFYTDFDHIFHFEKKSDVAIGVSSFPVPLPLTLNLYWFDGAYNNDKIVFEIWSSINNGDPEFIFETETRDLQSDYYPDVLSFDNGYGFALEALLEYRD